MKNKFTAATVVALAATGLVGLGGGTASAATVAPTCHVPKGYECVYGPAGATVHVGNPGGGYMYIYVCDTKNDGHSAYDWYNVGASTHQPTNRQETTGGNGTCTTALVLVASQITTQVCVNISGGADTCYPWLPVVRS